MHNGFNIDSLLDVLAGKIAARMKADTEQSASASAIRPRLLTVEQAAAYLGRSKASVQHMVSDGVLPTVRSDRRVFLDMRDLDNWIDRAKV